MTTTVLKRREAFAEPEAVALNAGGDIFRRLERRQRRPMWMAVVPFAVLAVFAIGGAIVFGSMMGSSPSPARTRTIPAMAPAVPAPVAAAAPTRASHATIKAVRHHHHLARARSPSSAADAG